MNPCIVIPTYNHVSQLPTMLARLRANHLPIIIVDDGSVSEIRNQISALASSNVEVLRHNANLGKGKALATAFERALERGFTHAVQIDADGQHSLDDIPKFLAAAKADPYRLILGCPIFDASAPSARVWGRKLSVLLVWLETFSLSILDPLCGFRVYPLSATLKILKSCKVGTRMDFDPEIAVRAVWSGLKTTNIPTKVTYATTEASNFDYLRDNLRMIYLHVRLITGLFGFGRR